MHKFLRNLGASHLEILGTGRVIFSKFHVDDPQILRATFKKFTSQSDMAPHVCASMIMAVYNISEISFGNATILNYGMAGQSYV